MNSFYRTYVRHYLLKKKMFLEYELFKIHLKKIGN